MNEVTNDKCDHDRCHCAPGPEQRITVGKRVFCSQGCAEGKGCRHEHCNCIEAEADS